MRANVKGLVQAVMPAVWDGKPILSKSGTPCHEVYLLQNGPGRAPELAKIKFYGKTAPKVGETKEFEVTLQPWVSKGGKAGVTAYAFEA